MKKLIPIVLLAIIVPQVAMAAWWNPMSWGIFKRSDRATEVQMLKNSTTIKPTPANKNSGLSVNLLVNGLDNQTTIKYGENADLSWTSTGNFVGCGVSQSDDDIAYAVESKGMLTMRNITKFTKFFISCTTAEFKSVTDSVIVFVVPK